MPGFESSRSLAEFLLQQLIDLRRVGLALGGFHRLTDQRVEGFGIARTDLFDVFGVRCQHIVDDFLEFACVAHLFEVLGLDQCIDIAALTCPQGVEHLPGSVV